MLRRMYFCNVFEYMYIYLDNNTNISSKIVCEKFCHALNKGSCWDSMRKLSDDLGSKSCEVW